MLLRITVFAILVSVFSSTASARVFPQSKQKESEATLTEKERTRYVKVKLTADLDQLSDNQKKMIGLLIEAGKQMDAAFWMQAYGDKEKLMSQLANPKLQRFAKINYGPWDRLKNNRPFVDGFGAKPAGANFYPKGLSKEDFEKHLEDNPSDEEAFKSLYTVIRRDDDEKLKAIPYSQAYGAQFKETARLLNEAAELAEDVGFKKYLTARAEALLSDDYLESDLLWMDMKTNELDVVIGPVENYEDQMNGYKAACECFVLVKDLQWSERLSKYATMLPELQKGLPVEDKYKTEKPGTKSDLNAYDVIYDAGDCNSGAKTIAINLPNDERVQLEKGSRRLQLKNAMKAKFDRILVPIADLLIVPEQRKHVTFNAFFSNTMFHEVAHGLGIKETITGKGPVRTALRESYSALEEGKADILGLFMVTELLERGEISEGTLEDYFVTFMAGIFRSIRFGASSAHGKANMIRFKFFQERNAFTRNDKGQYKTNIPEMKKAMAELSQKLLELQGDGDYGVARKFLDEMGSIGPGLQADLDRVNQQGIPTDIVFEQGLEALGLKK